jgi:hypothetical protein
MLCTIAFTVTSRNCTYQTRDRARLPNRRLIVLFTVSDWVRCPLHRILLASVPRLVPPAEITVPDHRSNPAAWH